MVSRGSNAAPRALNDQLIEVTHRCRAVRTRRRPPHLLRHLCVSCPSFASCRPLLFFLPERSQRNHTCPNEQCATQARLSIDPVKNIHRAGLDGDSRSCSTILPLARCVLRATFAPCAHGSTTLSSPSCREIVAYLSRASETSRDALCASALRRDSVAGP